MTISTTELHAKLQIHSFMQTNNQVERKCKKHKYKDSSDFKKS